MDNLRWVGIGLLIVFVDLRFNGVDFVSDSVGWVVAAVSLFSIASLHGGFRLSGVAALVGLVAWAADPWLGVDRSVASVLEVVAQTVIVFATCTALMDLVPQKRHSADLIRWWDLALGVVALGLGWLFEGETGGVAVLIILLVAVPAFAFYIAFLVLLFRCARLGPQQPVTHPAG